ncbi:DUF6786 family protein [Mariniphaga sediminis]|uniref:DUF6786 family protein n=1 Tax=Mariniphaga sediminis TaxID=1628158 RepID=UPI0035634E49
MGSLNAGAIIALDMEGRLFTVFDGEVLNHVNLSAIAEEGTNRQYLIAGGDGLWPAPEGTSLGYNYPTGKWRVPPGVSASRYLVDNATKKTATIHCEVDLINGLGIGIPTIFKRKISISKGKKSINVHVVETIKYIGNKPLRHTDAILAPWSLCMLGSGPGCKAIFPCKDKSSVWDLYNDAKCTEMDWDGSICRVATNGSHRYQVAMDEKVPWVEFHDINRGLIVHRQAEMLPVDQSYIDISDVPPDLSPSGKGVRYSVYSDTNNFMEIEVAGGCPDVINPGTEMSLAVNTQFRQT